MADEIFFLGGALLFLLAVIIFLGGWAVRERAERQQQALRQWEQDLREWATAQHENILAIQQRNAELEQELTAAKQEAERRELALRDHDAELQQLREELARVVAERDKLKADFTRFVDFLVEAGILHKMGDGMLPTPSDLQASYLQSFQTAQPRPAATDDEAIQLPHVLSLTTDQVRAALQHAAERAFSSHPNAARPFTQKYMVTEGTLSRKQFQRLRETLVEQGYLEPSGTRGSVFKLTDQGWLLLQAVKEGKL